MEKVKYFKWIKTNKIIDDFDGILSVYDDSNVIPFKIRRVYCIYNLINHEKVVRGKHAHKKLEQAMFCVNGSCDVLVDDGVNKQVIKLDEPDKGIYIGPKLWHEMFNFKNNCIILVFASDLYDESDYIRSYKDFLEFTKLEGGNDKV